MGIDLPRIEELLPHRKPALLLNRVLEHDGESTTVEVMIGDRTWLRRADGAVSSWVALEYMAQCIAAHEGIRALAEGRPPVRGTLAAAVGLRLYRPFFEPGVALRVGSRRVRGRPGLGVISHFSTVHEARGESGGALLAEGRLSISIPRDGA